MSDMSGMMGSPMAAMMTYWLAVSLLVLVILVLLAIWLFQQVRRQSPRDSPPGSRGT